MATVYKSVSRKENRLKIGEDLNVTIHDSSSEDERSSESPPTSPMSTPQPKSRVLLLTSRGVTHRHRHLLSDLHALLPHTYKDTKLDTKSSSQYNIALNSLSDLHSCNYIFFLEARKHGQDLYLWLSRAPNGPTIKFSVSNIHTMGELAFGGNCLKGGRGIVTFDKSYEEIEAGEEWKSLAREMLRGFFCVPRRGARHLKPFVDRVVGVFGVDGKVWIRVYEIRESEKAVDTSGEKARDTNGENDITLVEIGPRFVLTPIIIQEGSFGGPVIYQNKEFVSPNQVRREIHLKRAGKYAKRRVGADERKFKKGELGLDEEGRKRKDELDSTVLFA